MRSSGLKSTLLPDCHLLLLKALTFNLALNPLFLIHAVSGSFYLYVLVSPSFGMNILSESPIFETSCFSCCRVVGQ